MQTVKLKILKWEIYQNNVIIIFISIRYNLTKINNDLPDQRLLFIVKMQEITYKIRPVNSLQGEKRIK